MQEVGNQVVSSDEKILLNISKCKVSNVNSEKNSNKLFGSKRHYSPYLTVLKPKKPVKHGFIVGDIETVLCPKKKGDDHSQLIHIPYAMGFLVVKPGYTLDTLQSLDSVDREKRPIIHTYFSEEFPTSVFPSFEERSCKMMDTFISRLDVLCSKSRNQIKTVYFHNFSRFDGIILLKHLLKEDSQYIIKPLMLNNILYQISVYKGKKLLFHLRDSITLLPSNLESLAKNLCPTLGSKGSIDHDSVKVSNLKEKKDELIKYLRQDIILLGGIMIKAQEIYMSDYGVDIVSKLTVSSLALTIFRTKYYDVDFFPIHIPSMNEDSFIRKGYYGGHVDVYIPYGENLYYYDINSLYPHIMKSYPMPGGRPIWKDELYNEQKEEYKLENLCGFIEAHVECPRRMKRPFLPYRDPDNNSLIFPTGKFIGVYYSEELKFAKKIGYKITPLRGYLFQKMDRNPFENFVSILF